MTVKELIDYLSKIDSNIEVVVKGYEDGYDPIVNLHQKFIKPTTNPKWYYGKYEDGTGEESRLALLLSNN
jgi:hypothetical protein